MAQSARIASHLTHFHTYKSAATLEERGVVLPHLEQMSTQMSDCLMARGLRICVIWCKCPSACTPYLKRPLKMMFEHRPDQTQQMRWIILPLVINQVRILKPFQLFMLLPCLRNDNLLWIFVTTPRHSALFCVECRNLAAFQPGSLMTVHFSVRSVLLTDWSCRSEKVYVSLNRCQMEGVTVRWRLSVMRHQVTAIETFFIWQVKMWSRQNRIAEWLHFILLTNEGQIVLTGALWYSPWL